MLARLILMLVQLAVGWYGAMEVLPHLPRLGKLDIFLLAAIFAVIVWVLGLIAAVILKDISQPSGPTLLFAVGVAVLFAALTVVPDVKDAVTSVVGRIDSRIYPLVGAVLGYAVHR